MGTEIITAITTVGFPIVACVCMGVFIKYIIDKYDTARAEMTQALNNNTLAITLLSEKLDKEREEQNK